MSTFSSTGGSSQFTGSVSVGGASNRGVLNVAMAAADTEYSFSLPVNTRAFALKLRNFDNKAAVLRIYEVTGGVPYLSVNPGGTYARDGLLLSSTMTIYLQCNLAGRVAEVEYWY
jgi:hypothetical protein